MRNLLGAILLCDVATAFPALLHEFLFLALARRSVDPAFFNLVQAMYYAPAACSSFEGGEPSFLFMIGSGVIQGCPLSALLFMVSLDPFLRKFCELVPPSKGIVRACVDDVGFAIYSLPFVVK